MSDKLHQAGDHEKELRWEENKGKNWDEQTKSMDQEVEKKKVERQGGSRPVLKPETAGK